MSAETLVFSIHWVQVVFLCAVLMVSCALVAGIVWYLWHDIRRVLKNNPGPRG